MIQSFLIYDTFANSMKTLFFIIITIRFSCIVFIGKILKKNCSCSFLDVYFFFVVCRVR